MKKFCNQCGSDIEHESKFCSSCGIKVKKVEEEISVERVVEKTNRHFKDIGGWLWLPIIGLWAYLIISFIDLFIALKSLDPFDFIFTLVNLCALAYLLLLVKNRDHRFPKYFIYYSVASILINALAVLIIYNTGGSSKIETWYFQTTDIYRELTRSVIFGVIWTWYFSASERVSLTFVNGSDGKFSKIPKLYFFCKNCNVHYFSEKEVCPECNNISNRDFESKNTSNKEYEKEIENSISFANGSIMDIMFFSFIIFLIAAIIFRF
ncbi:MAG: DUF2569 family protein [Candidatus Nomurabacteria bacterium]